MPAIAYEKLLKPCIEICNQAAGFIQSHYGKLSQDDIVEKDANSLVSFVDQEAEKILVTRLGELLPEAGFITEEQTVSQDRKASMWIIDPLDGTSNFLYDLPHFAVSVALFAEEELQLGVIVSVMSGEVFSAVKGSGAF